MRSKRDVDELYDCSSAPYCSVGSSGPRFSSGRWFVLGIGRPAGNPVAEEYRSRDEFGERFCCGAKL